MNLELIPETIFDVLLAFTLLLAVLAEVSAFPLLEEREPCKLREFIQVAFFFLAHHGEQLLHVKRGFVASEVQAIAQ